MRKFLKQLFCDHIWKLDKIENLHYSLSMKTFVYKVDAVHENCIKCGKCKITGRKLYLGLGYINKEGTISMGIESLDNKVE